MLSKYLMRIKKKNRRKVVCCGGFCSEMATKLSVLCSFISSPPVDSSSSLAVPCFFSPIPRLLTLRISTSLTSGPRLPATDFRRSPLSLTSSLAVMLPENAVLSDVCATGIACLVAFSCLGFWGEIGKRGILDQVLSNSIHICTLYT